ncbi:MAG: tRNA (guanosine(46)-N7)-methyltransferase TrmB [Bacilli bacterium]|nr:tRNA (guanosine(46)-N7)-methyltransferase TrmB [Bacilli bacterium]
MRLRKIKNINEKIKKYEGTIAFNAKDNKGMWKKSFGNNNPVYLEIGTGKGNFIIENAKRNPEINYIGCEISDSVIYKAAKKAEGISNLTLINEDAFSLMDIFEDNEIEKIFLNFSDPWPKSRHEKRRLTSPGFLNIYKRILIEKGIIEFKSDNQHLFEYSLIKFNEQKWDFLDLNLNLHKENDEDIITTEYEDKFKALGQPIYYIKVRTK